MDIGTLTGRIVLEDQMTSVLTKVEAMLTRVAPTATQQLMKISATGAFVGNALAKVGFMALSFAKNVVQSSIMAGARLEQLGVATRFLGEKAGYSHSYIDNLSKKIEDTGISGIAARESIQSLLAANIDLTKAAELSAIAQNMQAISGKSSSEVFQTMTRALATGNTQLLRNIGFQGISIDTLKRASKATGEHVGVLSGQQRTQMILNAILKEGADKAGLYGESMTTAGKQASSASRAWDQVGEKIGTAVLPITNVAIKSWYKLGETVRDTVASAIPRVSEMASSVAASLQNIIDKVNGLTKDVVSAAVAVYERYQGLPPLFRDIAESAALAAGGIWLINKAVGVLAALPLLKWLLPAVAGIKELGQATIAFGWKGMSVWLGSWATSLAAMVGPLALIAADFALVAGWLKEIRDTLGSKVLKGTIGDLMSFVISGGSNVGAANRMAATTAVMGAKKDLETSPRTVAVDEVRKQFAEAQKRIANPTFEDFRPATRYNVLQDRPGVPGAGEAEELTDYQKKLKSLREEILGANLDVKAFAEVFGKLTPEQLKSEEVLKRLVPQIEKYADAGGKVSAAMKAVYADATALTQAQRDYDDEMVRASGLTNTQIENELMFAGSLAEVARMHGLSEAALKRVMERRKENVEAEVDQAAKELEIAEKSMRASVERFILRQNSAKELADLEKALAAEQAQRNETWAAGQHRLINTWVKEQLASTKTVGADFVKFVELVIRKSEEMRGKVPKIAPWSLAQSVSGTDEDIAAMLTGAGWDSGLKFKEAFASAVSKLGDVVVGALQGGGSVMKSVVGSLANNLGQFFMEKFKAQLAAANVGAMGSAIGTALTGAMIAAIVTIGLPMLVDVVKGFGEVTRAVTSTEMALEKLQLRFSTMGAEGLSVLRALGLELANISRTPSAGATATGSAVRRDGIGDLVTSELSAYRTKDELLQIAAQYKEVYDIMLASGLYTAKTLADAWKKYQDAMRDAVGDPEDTRPEGARGFPTRSELVAAAQAAEEAYNWMLQSGLYTSEVLTEAWDAWQDALIASGDSVAKRMRELNDEILTLQKAVAEELPEYDSEGVRIYGVIEQQNIDRLKALEKEKADLALVQIAEQRTAEEAAAREAENAAKVEMEKAKKRAKDLDDYMFKLFSKGYDIPIRFTGVPGAPGTGGGGTPSVPTTPSSPSQGDTGGGGGGGGTAVFEVDSQVLATVLVPALAKEVIRRRLG